MSDTPKDAATGPAQEAGPNGTPTPAADDLVTTEHTLDLPGGPLRYRATTGRMVVGEEKLDDGVFRGWEARAQVFLTAYTALGDGGAPDPARPVVFAFNGGPGSSSVWLHLGLFGPRRVLSGDVEDRTPPPYGLTDNAETLLAHADLVFIDPMTTGYSRAVVGGKPAEYHGFSGDRDLVGEAIRLWLTRNDRWLSPKFLAGESYGTTRAAALAGHLAQRHGIAFNGVMLISAVLDLGTVFFTEGNDAPYVHYLPTYAAVAHYHGKHPGRALADVVAEAQAFADTDYTLALARGSRLGERERQQVAGRLAALTGIDIDHVLRSDLRLEHKAFFAELLRDQGLMVGRLDSRFTAHPGHLTLAEMEADPSYHHIQFPYTAAVNHYLRAELGYDSDLTYEIITGRVQPWSYKEFENRSVTTAEDLASAMRANPDLKVYVAFGYHDGATPFAASEHVLAHLRLPAEAHGRIVRRYYEAGHMMYVHEPSRLAQSRDLVDFVAWGVGTGPRPESDGPATTAGRL
ncbi:S10 family peptidase [Georgenia alba]|uniref:S10 family peptidase n=1 Tax=Georgenia alba TaxID=2233858 RepID=A0ABW2QBM1_9MICO